MTNILPVSDLGNYNIVLRNTGNVELRYADESMISIDWSEVEDAVATSLNAPSKLDWLICNAPLDYAELALCNDLGDFKGGKSTQVKGNS